MPDTTMVLNRGGLRGLVATAVVLSRIKPVQVVLLYVHDQRPADRRRVEHIRQQASHFGIDRQVELGLPQLVKRRESITAPEQSTAALYRSQLLILGLAQCIEWPADRLTWPAQCNADFDQCAQATEQIVLAQSLAQLQTSSLPPIDTPLLELDDQQVIELGGQLEVPFELAWSCLLNSDAPCRVCIGCRQRREAFEAAGMVDPIDEEVIAR